MKTQFYKRTAALVLTLATLFLFIINVSAVTDTAQYSWYVMRKKGHEQPDIAPEFSFIEEVGGYYLDRDHASQEDADKVLYLTFDAGYENGNVERIVDTLNEKGVKGTFFILDNMIDRFPDLVKKMAEGGHFVCNHTCRHRDMSKVTDMAEFSAELNELSDKYKALTGLDMPKFYRPPEGRFSKLNLMHASEMGYKTLFWSFAYADWDNAKQPAPDTAIQKILENTHNGAIILLHPTSKTNADIIGTLIDKWREEGYRFATPDEL